jgi:hypothetical protein
MAPTVLFFIEFEPLDRCEIQRLCALLLFGKPGFEFWNFLAVGCTGFPVRYYFGSLRLVYYGPRVKVTHARSTIFFKVKKEEVNYFLQKLFFKRKIIY